MRRPQDATLVLEACFSAHVNGALVYPENLTARFFDLSSGEAGVVLDKLRRFGIHLAIVCAPGSVEFSSRFREILSDDLRVFETQGDGARMAGADIIPREVIAMFSRREFNAAGLATVAALAAGDADAASQQPAASSAPAPLKTEFLMDAIFDVAAPQTVGPRRIVPVTGGTFEGPKLKGTALGGGADWILLRPDGVSELSVRVILKTDDDQLINLTYRGLLFTPKGGEQYLAHHADLRNRSAEIRVAEQDHRGRRRQDRSGQGRLQHLPRSVDGLLLVMLRTC